MLNIVPLELLYHDQMVPTKSKVRMDASESCTDDGGCRCDELVKMMNCYSYTNPPLPGGTAILPEYIHYYGYYNQVIVQC
jgi:hypothetical protein